MTYIHSRGQKRTQIILPKRKQQLKLQLLLKETRFLIKLYAFQMRILVMTGYFHTQLLDLLQHGVERTLTWQSEQVNNKSLPLSGLRSFISPMVNFKEIND